MAVAGQLIITGFFIFLFFFYFSLFGLIPIPQGSCLEVDTGKGESCLMCPKKFGAGEERKVFGIIHTRWDQEGTLKVMFFLLNHCKGAGQIMAF